MTRPRFATLWLDGCSGCHMSLLDMDERLLELATLIDVVYSPLVDNKRFPDRVDVVCIEGAVSTSDDEARLRLARQRSSVLIALGDCAVTGNVPAMRNPQGSEAMLRTVYQERPLLAPRIPGHDLPHLHHAALPLHHFAPVDLFLPGCPPGADAIHGTLMGLLTGSPVAPQLHTRFGG